MPPSITTAIIAAPTGAAAGTSRRIAAAVLVLVPKVAPVGAAMIALVMLGGMGTHVYWGRPGQVTSEVVPLVLSLVVLAGRLRLRRSAS